MCCRASGACCCMYEHVSLQFSVQQVWQQVCHQSSKLCFLNARYSWTLAMPLVHSQTVCSCNAHPLACCESGVMLLCPSIHRCLQSQKRVSPTRSSGNACKFLQQLGIITVVVVHSVFRAEPSWPDASWLLNRFQELWVAWMLRNVPHGCIHMLMYICCCHVTSPL